MRTWVSDTFPLKELECQYFDICRGYNPKECNYTSSCELRGWLREVIEPYIPNYNLKLQIGLILDERRRRRRKN